METNLENASIAELKRALSKKQDKDTKRQLAKVDSGKFDVLRLDGNIHIYCHASSKEVERGDDEKGRFIKLYYTQIE